MWYVVHGIWEFQTKNRGPNTRALIVGTDPQKAPPIYRNSEIVWHDAAVIKMVCHCCPQLFARLFPAQNVCKRRSVEESHPK